MAIVNTKSTVVTNADALVLNSSYLQGGIVKSAVGTVEIAAGDDDLSVFRMVRIPSGARIISMEVFNDAITNGTAYELGCYQTSANGGAIVGTGNQFATTVTMATARVAPLDITFEALNIDSVQKRLWEVLGLTADPYIDYDICFLATTVGTVAGTLTLRVLYTV